MGRSFLRSGRNNSLCVVREKYNSRSVILNRAQRSEESFIRQPDFSLALKMTNTIRDTRICFQES